MAGVSSFQYPLNIRIIRVIYASRIDPSFILNAIEKGIDGIIVNSCRIGDCNYITRKYFAKKRF